MSKHWKKFFLPIAALLIILPTILPLFRSDFFRMHDFTHVARLVELDVALKDDQIPPRWSPDFGWSFGMPLLHFYSPLPYYLAEIFYSLGLTAVWSIKLVFALNFLAGFYFMYLWAKEFFGKWGGLVSATAFTYLPYRAVQFYIRGTLGELTAMTFLPLFFYGAYKLVKEKKLKFAILTSLAITGVFLSHNVIALFSIFFFGLYFIWQLFLSIKKKKKKIILPKKAIVLSVFSTLLAFGLTAFFILPAFFEKDFTIVSTIAGGYSHYSLHFIYLRQLLDRRWAYGGSVLGPFDDISFQIGMPHIFLAALSVIPFLLAIKKKNKSLFFIFLSFYLFAFISIFMMTFHSKSLWDKLEFIHIAQFPWRFLTFTGTFFAFLSGAIFTLMKKGIVKPLTILAILITIGLNFTFFKPEKYSPIEDFYYTDREKIKTRMSGILFDYIPKWAKKNPKIPEKPFISSGSVENWRQKTGYVSFKSISENPTDFALNKFYFPGWQAFVNGKEIEIDHKNDLGRIEFKIPTGVQQVVVKLGKTKLQFWSDIISLVSWGGLLIYLITRTRAVYKI